jgi:hypothetical protein
MHIVGFLLGTNLHAVFHQYRISMDELVKLQLLLAQQCDIIQRSHEAINALQAKIVQLENSKSNLTCTGCQYAIAFLEPGKYNCVNYCYGCVARARDGQ